MNDETQSLFKELEPPPGGAERFARRLDEAAHAPGAPRWRGFALAGAAAAIVLVVAIVLLRPTDDAPTLVARGDGPNVYDAPEFDRLLGRPTRPTELSVTLDERTASIVEVETTNEKIRIYEIN